MAKEIDKIIQSPTAPKDKNVLWDDGKELKINRRGVWENTTKNAGGEIDPVVWKYMCNPYEIPVNGGMVPEELRNIIEDEDGGLRKIASKLIVMNDHDNISHIITDISYSFITSKWGTLIYSHGSFEPER